MATVTSPRSRTFVGSFYIVMAAIFAAIAFSGFFMTYWLPVARGTFVASPMLHLHGLLFSLWTLFFLSQAVLVANGGLRHHKAWGLAGISLATAMIFVGMAVAINGLDRRLELGYGDAARAFAFVPMSAVLLFAGLTAAAMANLRRPEWHKRFMLVATAVLLQPAIARYFFVLAGKADAAVRQAGPPPPVSLGMPVLIVDALILVAVLYDWKARGRLHPAYAWGFGAVLVVHLLRPFISRTEAWYAVADFLARFNG